MSDRAGRPGHVHLERPSAFVAGTVLIAIGVVLHIPDFLATSAMGYMMTGMAMSPMMLAGMGLIVAGLALSVWGIWPRRSLDGWNRITAQLTAMDGAPLRHAHRILAMVLGVAVVIDTMKPATLGFVLPGLAEEYGISIGGAAALPFVALTGTTVGSLLWGLLADRVGRRTTILLTGLLFMATSICGFMPEFGWNLFMCLIMGASAGGMLPITFALMAESVPATHRGWLIVLQTGLGTVGGYLLASSAAALLEPHLSWRVLWALGLPTGAVLLVLNRWIPESPRFLLAAGRTDEAHAVMRHYGITAHPVSDLPTARHVGRGQASVLRDLSRLFGDPYSRQTATILLYGLAWGLVNWGFITFLPTLFERHGTTGNMLFLSAMLAIPNTAVAAYLYGRWSSRRTMALYALLAVLALAGFAAVSPAALSDGLVPILLTGLLLTSTGGMIATLAPFATEVYPTGLRASGSGLAAAASKAGGMIGPPLAGALAGSTSLRAVAILAAIPVASAAISSHRNAQETAGAPLPETPPPRPVVPDQ